MTTPTIARTTAILHLPIAVFDSPAWDQAYAQAMDLLDAAVGALQAIPSSNFLFGAGNPSNAVGSNGDIYIDNIAFTIWQKSAGIWVSQGSFAGPTASSTIGTFTLTAAATTSVSSTVVTANSQIAYTPTNAAAATFEAAHGRGYISARAAGQSFSLTFVSGVPTGTETYSYRITG